MKIYLLMADDGEYGFNKVVGVFDNLDSVKEVLGELNPTREIIIKEYHPYSYLGRETAVGVFVSKETTSPWWEIAECELNSMNVKQITYEE